MVEEVLKTMELVPQEELVIHLQLVHLKVSQEALDYIAQEVMLSVVELVAQQLVVEINLHLKPEMVEQVQQVQLMELQQRELVVLVVLVLDLAQRELQVEVEQELLKDQEVQLQLERLILVVVVEPEHTQKILVQMVVQV